MKKTNKQSNPDPLLKRISESCGKAITSLDDCIERVASNLAGADGADYDKDLASHLAWLTKNVAQIGGEVRKMESHEAKLSDIQPAILIEHFRKMTAGERSAWVRDIQAMDRKGSVLS